MNRVRFVSLEDNTIVMFSSDNGPEYNVENNSPQKNDPDAQANLEASFNNFDQNSDGKLTREEFVGTAAVT